MPPRRSLRIDREQLAWAAGFFDGEGSTIARTDSDRPGYRQLVVAVPQAGSATPHVLQRFQAAMLGMGRIDPPSSAGTFSWRSRGFADAQQTLILLWPYLGEVKRRQAASAMRSVSAQYASGAYRARRPKSSLVLVGHRVARSGDESRLDRAWAAGFLDAEGCFGLIRAHERRDGSRWYRIRASANQHGEVGRVPDVLTRLHRVLGIGRIERHGDPDDYKWLIQGVPGVREVLTVVGPWLGSIKREQARDALADVLAQRRVRGGGERCLRGHLYDRRVALPSGKSRGYCNACDRLLGRRARARHGISPRRFRDVKRRYTE